MICYRNISDEPFFDKITGEHFLPGEDIWIFDEVQPDDLLQRTKNAEEARAVAKVRTNHLISDLRLVAIKQSVIDPKNNEKQVETVLKTEAEIEVMKERYLKS